MAYINNKKLMELRGASQNGDEKATRIIQLLRSNGKQMDIDSLVNEYYLPKQVSQEVVKAKVEPQETQIFKTEPQVEDLTGVLDKDLDGIVTKEEIGDTSFCDFLKKKKNDGLKGTRNADYFKMYDPAGRANYMTKKGDEYASSFDGKLKDIDRQYKDMNSSLSKYLDSATVEGLDDGIELSMEGAAKAYNDMTDSHDMMLGLGRAHDEDDFNAVKEKLSELMQQYGKKNVIAALHTLKSDNDNHKSYRMNQIDSEISRYKKSLENLLK